MQYTVVVRAALERLLSPGLGRCYCCNRPWRTNAQRRVGRNTWQQLDRMRWWGLVGVVPHTTRYTPTSGCFPLCEGCWQRLATPQGRYPYYLQLIERWEELGPPVPLATKADIAVAVAAGL